MRFRRVLEGDLEARHDARGPGDADRCAKSPFSGKTDKLPECESQPARRSCSHAGRQSQLKPKANQSLPMPEPRMAWSEEAHELGREMQQRRQQEWEG